MQSNYLKESEVRALTAFYLKDAPRKVNQNELNKTQSAARETVMSTTLTL
jgi:hypothetical protein